MINRTYFMSVKKSYGEGTNYYSFNSCVFSYRSLFPNAEKVKNSMIKRLNHDMTAKDFKTSVEIMSFNRV